MKLVIFGATGATGRALIRQAVQRGHTVTALVRNPTGLPATTPPCSIVQGDVRDIAAVARAVEGADAALSALGVRQGRPAEASRSQGTANIVQALQAAGVRRFVSVSTVGAGEHLATLPWMARVLLPRIIGRWRLEEAGLQEQMVRASSLDWVVLRPPRLLDGEGLGDYCIGNDLKTGLGSSISREDLATALLDQVASDRFLHQSPTVFARAGRLSQSSHAASTASLRAPDL